MKKKEQGMKNEKRGRKIISIEVLPEKDWVRLNISVNGLYSFEAIGMLTEALDKIRQKELEEMKQDALTRIFEKIAKAKEK